jgi:MoaA/NifB/PqqE/SkfB family radical SAM enzyme
MKCLAPWKAIAVRFNGDVNPDCVYTGRHGNLHEDTLADIMVNPGLIATQASVQQGILPANCSQCTKKEQANGHSRRIFFDQLMPDVPRTYENDIRFLEINISNKCNQQCVMCSGVNSTTWVKMDERLNAISKDFMRPLDHPDFGYRIVQPNIIDKLFEDASQFKNLQHVNIKGGEPFMEQDNIKLLHKLLSMNLQKQVTLDLSTNGTVANPEFEELLLEFNTKIHISIEGVNKMYEYIRGGKHVSFSEFETNIHRFDKFDRIIFAGTVMTYNVNHIKEVYDWVNGLNNPRYEIFFNNTVASPSYLDPRLLPQELLVGTDYSHDDSLNPMVDVFVRYTNTMDELRGMNVLDVSPELAPLFT